MTYKYSEYGSENVCRRSGLAYVEKQARSSEERYDRWISFKKRLKRSLARVISAEKEKAEKKMPAF